MKSEIHFPGNYLLIPINFPYDKSRIDTLRTGTVKFQKKLS